MDCGSCGAANESGRKFCKACGSPLAIVCGVCGSANTPDSRFCGECGSELTTAAPLAATAPPAPAATGSTERRLVSVLFVDLVGFTTISEHRDAEDVRELLSRYFVVARAAVERHGGLIEKFIGDAVMAVWGAPTAHEDDAERAVRTALEIVDGVAALGRDLGLELQARAGVLTGEAATVAGDGSEGYVTGDMVNTASRVQSVADPGTVFVGEATYRAASGAVSFEPVGELTLKGKDEPVRAWRATRVVAHRGGGAKRGPLEPPFVGRDEELRLIKELLHATERDGRTRLVSITGMAGIGKSRLAWELEKYLDGLAATFFWHQGRCPSYGEGVTFWALGEMARMRAGIAETDDVATSAGALAETVAMFVPDEEERRWIEPRLAHLLGLADAPPGEREELFSAWRAFFERIAAQGPVVMVFEDLQWADAGLLDFIESILEWSRNGRILIVTLSRPELLERRPTWGVGQRNFTALHLDPLDEDAMTRLVEGYVRGLPAEGVERIVARAEGVPLYAVETVRMLLDRGVVVADEHSFSLAGELGELEVPESLQALIAARLDVLDAETRSLVQDAAVLGKSFTLQGIVSVTGREEADVAERLRDLVRREILVHQADPRSPERGMYGFLQSLIREVAYGMLAKADRRQKHLAAAHHLESLEDEELAGVVATHYVEAYRATQPGPEADALAARARDSLVQASERASSLGSPEQALTFAEQALDLPSGVAERLALLERAGRAAMRADRTDRGLAQLEEVADAYLEEGDVESSARVVSWIASPLAGFGRRNEADALLQRAITSLGERGHDLVRAELYAALSNLANDAAEFEEALAHAERALTLAEQLHDPVVVCSAIGARAGALWSLGRHLEARMLFDGSVPLVDTHGRAEQKVLARLSLGIAHSEDDPAAALGWFQEAIDVARRLGVRGLETLGYANALEAAIDVGRWDVADEIVAELDTRELNAAAEGGFILCVAMLEAFRGDPGGAIQRLEAADERFATLGEMLSFRTWERRTWATVLLMEGKLEEAFESASEVMRVDPAGMNAPSAAWAAGTSALWLRDPERLRAVSAAMGALSGSWIETCRRTLEAGLDALEGRASQAAEGFADAIARFEALSSPLDASLATIAAAMLVPPDLLPDDAVARARSTLGSIGARPLLARLESVAGAEVAAPSA